MITEFRAVRDGQIYFPFETNGLDHEEHFSDAVSLLAVAINELVTGNFAIEWFSGVTDTSAERRKIFDGDLIQPTAASYRIVKVVRFIPDRAAFMMANIEDLTKDWLDPWQPLSQRWVDDCRAVVGGNIHGAPI
jgi:hypothetical protein